MDLGLEGKRAAVAAASLGLGYASAKALVAEGARVAICGRDETRVARAAESLGTGVFPIVADMATTEGATAFIKEATAELGGLDILVPNAGGPPAGTFTSTPLELYPKALELNLLSVVTMCLEAVPMMRAQRWGRVVAITSIAVRQPIENLILSNTARAGATGFLKTLALEVAGDGVTVNSVQPGFHETDRLRRLHGDNLEALAAQIPVGAVGSPDDFGAVVAFLCSEQAGFITGAAIPIEGGSHRSLL